MNYQLFQLPKATPIHLGVVVPGAKANFYATTTSTRQDTFTTSALSGAHANPVVADTAGLFPPIYLDPALLYKLTLTTAADVLIYTVDPCNDNPLSQAAIGQAIYPRSATEIAAAITPTNYIYPPGHVWRYCSSAQIANILSATTQNLSPQIQNAIDSTTGDVYFPSGTYYIGAPLYIRSTSFLNIRFVGESRVSTYIYPNAIDISDGNGNFLFINQQDNGKVSWYRIRLSSGGGIAWTGKCISANPAGSGNQKVIFSGSIDQCWIDPGSTNTGFFQGGLINYTVTNTTFEFLKGCFDFNAPTSDVLFSNISLSNSYDYFIQSTSSGNGEIHVCGFDAYVHNRGVLFVATGAYDLRFLSCSVQAAVANLGTVGLFDLEDCSGVAIDSCTALSNAVNSSLATGGTTTTVLTDSTLALTVNAFAGYTLYNNTRGLSQTIISNTATTITTAAIAAQVSGDRYEILWPNTGLPVGFGPIATAMIFSGVKGVVSNCLIRGVGIGIAMEGTGIFDMSFNNVSVRNSVTAAYRNQSTGATGSVRLSDSDFSEGLLGLVTFFNEAGYEFTASDSRFMNAGLGGSTTARNLSLSSTGNIRLVNCTYGQSSALAVAARYVTAAGSGAGTLEIVSPKIIGTPPTALSDGAQAIVYDGIDSTMPGMPQLVPVLGGTTTYTTQQGQWSLRNKRVDFSLRLTVNVIGTGSVRDISGLPWTSHSAHYGGVSVSFFSGAATAIIWPTGFVAPADTRVQLRDTKAAVTGTVNDAIFGNATDIVMQGSYPVP